MEYRIADPIVDTNHVSANHRILICFTWTASQNRTPMPAIPTSPLTQQPSYGRYPHGLCQSSVLQTLLLLLQGSVRDTHHRRQLKRENSLNLVYTSHWVQGTYVIWKPWAVRCRGLRVISHVHLTCWGMIRMGEGGSGKSH